MLYEVITGDVVNTGEKRMVLHHQTRGMKIDDVVADGQNITEFYAGEKQKAFEFAKKVHSYNFV